MHSAVPPYGLPDALSEAHVTTGLRMATRLERYAGRGTCYESPQWA